MSRQLWNRRRVTPVSNANSKRSNGFWMSYAVEKRSRAAGLDLNTKGLQTQFSRKWRNNAARRGSPQREDTRVPPPFSSRSRKACSNSALVAFPFERSAGGRLRGGGAERLGILLMGPANAGVERAANAAGPKLLAQFVAGDHFARFFEQPREHTDRCSLELDRNSTPPQQLSGSSPAPLVN